MAHSTKVPSCPICYDPYRSVPAASAEAKHLPKSLPCGHTICQGCAEMLQKNAAIRCPKDQKEFQGANACDLPNNFAILEQLEEMQIDEPPQGTPANGHAGGEAEPLCKDHTESGNSLCCVSFVCLC